MRIAMTGATGMLGSELLFEIVKQHLNCLDQLQLFVLGRANDSTPPQRIQDLFTSGGLDYMQLSPDAGILKHLRNAIIPIVFDFSNEEPGLAGEDLSQLRNGQIDFFFHVGSLTDLRHDSAVQAQLENSNISGTNRLLRLLDRLDVARLAYVGTAYVCGSNAGDIHPTDVDLHQKFRNPYEKTKLQAEILFREYAYRRNTKCYIFRPSTIAGRLLENPIGYTRNFEVFYGWAAWFLKQKSKRFGSLADLLEQPIEMNIRLRVNPKGGLNIVPVDYVAKMLIALTCEDNNCTEYHLANREETLHIDHISWMLESINITGFTFVENEPEDQNSLERLYYRSLGKVYTPYMISGPMNFDTSNLKQTEGRLGVTCPRIDQVHFGHLMNYAKAKRFGLDELM